MAGEAARVVGLKGEAFPKDVSKAPHSVQAEQALLGAIMVNNRAYDDLHGRLEGDHFYVPLHGAVFAAIEAIVNDRGGEANPITIRERLRGSNFDADEKLFPHLTGMFESAGFAGDVRSLADVILTAYKQRQLMGLAENLHTKAREASRPEDVDVVVDSAGSELFRLSEAGGQKIGARGMRENLIEVIRQAEAAKQSGAGITGIASGFADLDRLLNGFQRSDLVILGARPSMGKTSLLLNIAHTVAARQLRKEARGAPVAVFSLEMSAEQLTQRMLAADAGLASQRISSGQFSEGDFDRMVGCANELQSLPLYIDDTPGLSITALRARARQLKRKHAIGLIIVDYLQLLTAPIKGDYNRVQEISLISQGLKHVARELDVPVIAASQLSRQVDSRDNKRPQLSDLRESGSIEQDADVVMLLYREDYYLSRALGGQDEQDTVSVSDRSKLADARVRLEAVRGITEVLVSKNRKGPTDTVKLRFDGATTTFANYSGR